jgi:hypothetical protein
MSNLTTTTRGRKPIPQNDPVDIPGSVVAVATENGHAANQLIAIDQEAEQRAVQLAGRLGYTGSLSPDILEYAVAQHMHRTVEACLETGRMLLLLKERVAHGDFEHRLERLGLAPRAARKFMQSSLKFSNRPSTAALTSAIGSQGKLIELLVLDDDEVQELAEEGSTLGISLDDLAGMTSKELRAALRKAREDLAAKDDLVALKNEKIDQLQIAKKFKPRPESVAANDVELQIVEELHDCARAAEVNMAKLRNALEAVGSRPSPAMRKRCMQVVELCLAHLADIADSNNLEIDMAKAMDLRPAWLDQIEKSAAHATNAG